MACPSMCVFGCTYSLDKHANITYYTFPLDPDVRKEWLKALDSPGFVPDEDSKVCSEHFLFSPDEDPYMVPLLKTPKTPMEIYFLLTTDYQWKRPSNLRGMYNVLFKISRYPVLYNKNIKFSSEQYEDACAKIGTADKDGSSLVDVALCWYKTQLSRLLSPHIRFDDFMQRVQSTYTRRPLLSIERRLRLMPHVLQRYFLWEYAPFLETLQQHMRRGDVAALANKYGVSVEHIQRIWFQVCHLAQLKLQWWSWEGDRVGVAPPVAGATPAELAAANSPLVDAVCGRWTVVYNSAGCSALWRLLELVRRYGLEPSPHTEGEITPPMLQRWVSAYREYCNSEVYCPLLVLQRRWLQLKADARRAALEGQQLRKLHMVVLKRYQHLLTGRVPSWSTLVSAGAVHNLTEEEIAAVPSIQPLVEDDDDRQLVIDLEKAPPDRHTDTGQDDTYTSYLQDEITTLTSEPDTNCNKDKPIEDGTANPTLLMKPLETLLSDDRIQRLKRLHQMQDELFMPAKICNDTVQLESLFVPPQELHSFAAVLKDRIVIGHPDLEVGDSTLSPTDQELTDIPDSIKELHSIDPSSVTFYYESDDENEPNNDATKGDIPVANCDVNTLNVIESVASTESHNLINSVINENISDANQRTDSAIEITVNVDSVKDEIANNVDINDGITVNVDSVKKEIAVDLESVKDEIAVNVDSVKNEIPMEEDNDTQSSFKENETTIDEKLLMDVCVPLQRLEECCPPQYKCKITSTRNRDCSRSRDSSRNRDSSCSRDSSRSRDSSCSRDSSRSRDSSCSRDLSRGRDKRQRKRHSVRRKDSSPVCRPMSVVVEKMPLSEMRRYVGFPSSGWRRPVSLPQGSASHCERPVAQVAPLSAHRISESDSGSESSSEHSKQSDARLQNINKPDPGWRKANNLLQPFKCEAPRACEYCRNGGPASVQRLASALRLVKATIDQVQNAEKIQIAMHTKNAIVTKKCPKPKPEPRKRKKTSHESEKNAEQRKQDTEQSYSAQEEWERQKSDFKKYFTLNCIDTNIKHNVVHYKAQSKVQSKWKSRIAEKLNQDCTQQPSNQNATSFMQRNQDCIKQPSHQNATSLMQRNQDSMKQQSNQKATPLMIIADLMHSNKDAQILLLDDAQMSKLVVKSKPTIFNNSFRSSMERNLAKIDSCQSSQAKTGSCQPPLASSDSCQSALTTANVQRHQQLTDNTPLTFSFIGPSGATSMFEYPDMSQINVDTTLTPPPSVAGALTGQMSTSAPRNQRVYDVIDLTEDAPIMTVFPIKEVNKAPVIIEPSSVPMHSAVTVPVSQLSTQSVFQEPGHVWVTPATATGNTANTQLQPVASTSNISKLAAHGRLTGSEDVKVTGPSTYTYIGSTSNDSSPAVLKRLTGSEDVKVTGHFTSAPSIASTSIVTSTSRNIMSSSDKVAELVQKRTVGHDKLPSVQRDIVKVRESAPDNVNFVNNPQSLLKNRVLTKVTSLPPNDRPVKVVTLPVKASTSQIVSTRHGTVDKKSATYTVKP